MSKPHDWVEVYLESLEDMKPQHPKEPNPYEKKPKDEL